MTILDYINELIEEGYTEYQAEVCADILFNDDYDTDEEDY